MLCLRFGTAAIKAVGEGKFGSMVSLRSAEIHTVPIEEAIGQMKSVSAESDIIMTARSLGISFGD
jgi:6-phosphofructokinase 1